MRYPGAVFMVRRRLVEAETGSLAQPSPMMPPNRLMTLLEQAVAFQIDSGRYHPKVGNGQAFCFVAFKGACQTKFLNRLSFLSMIDFHV